MRFVRALVVLSVVAVAAPAEAQIEWSDEWNTHEPWDLVAAGVLGVGTLIIHLTTESDDGYWLRRNALDEGVLRGLHAPTSRGRRIAGILSDVTRSITMVPPLLVDTSLAARDDIVVAGRLASVSVLALATTTFLMTGAKYAFRRERPSVRRCVPDAENEECLGGHRYRSFFSGHAALSFTAASLTCTYHTRLPLYGRRRADLAACGVALGMATLTGILRIVAERHHFSDIVVGALVGMITGFLMPAALYFGFER